jgi:hypothetical protein
MSQVSSTRERGRRRPLPVRTGVAVVLSVLANGALVVAATGLGVAPGFRPLALPPVAVLSAAGAVGAAAAYWLLSRVVADADRWFRRVAVAALLLSFVPDAALLAADPAATVPGVVALAAMHVVVAALSVWALVYWGRDG